MWCCSRCSNSVLCLPKRMNCQANVSTVNATENKRNSPDQLSDVCKGPSYAAPNATPTLLHTMYRVNCVAATRAQHRLMAKASVATW